MPTYNCGVEVQAALDAGLIVRYYRVTPDLSVDEEDLEKQLRSCPGPVLLIHYFGFPQTGIERIFRLCQELGSVLIEDCAHALFSSLGETPLGLFAPVSVFSLRKTLPLYDGGTLLVNGSRFGTPPSPSPSLDPYRCMVKDAIRRTLGLHLTEALRRWRATGKEPEPARPAWEFQASYYRQGFSLLSHRLASSANPTAIVGARRQNWQRVHNRLSTLPGHRPVWNKLPPGTCPLFYCLWARDRDSVMERLSEAGVETFRFGARAHPTLDLSSYPESLALRQFILGFPVHQGLDPHLLDRALDIYCSL
jgi:dTDP-4-amino-4,6-dideoxygalactose transaminase